jgi:hypothetical protein
MKSMADTSSQEKPHEFCDSWGFVAFEIAYAMRGSLAPYLGL